MDPKTRLRRLILGLITLACAAPVHAQRVLTLQPVQYVTGIDQGQADGIFDDVSPGNAGVENNGYTELRGAASFDLSSLAAQRISVRSATLSLTINSTDGNREFVAHAFGDDGGVQLTDFARDATVGHISLPPSFALQTVSFDVTSLLNNVISRSPFLTVVAREEPANTSNFLVMYVTASLRVEYDVHGTQVTQTDVANVSAFGSAQGATSVNFFAQTSETRDGREGFVTVSTFNPITFTSTFISCSGPGYGNVVTLARNGDVTISATLDPAAPNCQGNAPAALELSIAGRFDGMNQNSQNGTGNMIQAGVTYSKYAFQSSQFSERFEGNIGAFSGMLAGSAGEMRRHTVAQAK